ncbi:MAG: restriction endonuclease [Streptosporangiaceae bacterium]|nr:restriction endonuclease [Streptosporangiaceae bacterium]
MPRRKSLLAQMYESRQKAKLQQQKLEEQAARAWAAEERRVAAQMEKEAAQERRETERAAQARLREEQQAERAREQEAAKAERLAAQQQRERERQAAAEARERQRREAAERREQQAGEADRRRRAVERRISEAEVRTEAVRATVAAFERLLIERNRNLAARSRRAEDAFNADGPEAFVEAIQRALATSVYPDGLDGSSAAQYIPESRELWVEYELPRQDVIPAVTGYRYVKTKDEVVPEPRKAAEVNKLYERLIARVALRTLAEAFDVAPAALVSGIVFNGYVSAKDRATGKPVRPLLLSVHAPREEFAGIVLDEPELDPKACLRSYLNALISPHPYDLEAVTPVVQFDLRKFKFVEEMNVVAGLDSRPDLLALKPVEFEHLIRELFEAMGLKSWVTQASKDEGVDGVAVNEDPIVGGLCIIQAKRYSKIVGLEAVHALAGVMEDKNAAKGVLVTTSWVGKASRDFAARNGSRIEIIEGRHLKSLLREHLGLDVLIGLPKLPPGWERHEVS